MSENLALPDNVAAKLRAMIVRGSLSPNVHLRQSEIAERFGLSKVPVREALKLLATEGLLIHDRNRGYFIAPVDLDEAMQLYRLRRWLESELLRTARWPTAGEIHDFRQRFEALDALSFAGKRTEWLDALHALRKDLFDLSPDKVLLREAMRLWTLTDRYRAMLPRDYQGSPERKLLDAMETRDRSALLAEYHRDRDGLEELLRQSLADE